MKPLTILALVIGLLLSPANGGVVSNTNFILTPDASFGGNYRFTALQDEAGTDPTSIWLSLSGQTLLPLQWNIDEEADYYLVPSLAVFSAATIASGIFPPLFAADQPHSVNVGFSDFYLGINTGQGIPTPGQPGRSVFGWVHLSNQAGTLTMLGNAMSYGGQGIIVGTTTVVPEPSTIGLLGLGIYGVAITLRRKRPLPNRETT